MRVRIAKASSVTCTSSSSHLHRRGGEEGEGRGGGVDCKPLCSGAHTGALFLALAIKGDPHSPRYFCQQSGTCTGKTVCSQIMAATTRLVDMRSIDIQIIFNKFNMCSPQNNTHSHMAAQVTWVLKQAGHVILSPNGQNLVDLLLKVGRS